MRRVATFNINGVNKRLANLLEWFAREAPDIVCLQELKVSSTQSPAREPRACYRRLLAQGWLDALHVKHPGERIYTFWPHWLTQ